MEARHPERGSILILTALSMVLLLGVAALAIDGSFMYTERNRMAAAADAAALSAAMELRRSAASNLQAFANREVLVHGLTPSPGGDTSVAVASPPTSGSHTGVPGYVQVTVSRPTTTFFARILGGAWTSVTPAASAVAGTSAGPNCIITLAPIGNPTPGLSIGNTVLNMPNCGVANTGDLDGTNPNAEIISTGITIGASSCTGRCDNMHRLYPNSPPPLDPFAGHLAAISHGACSAAPAGANVPGNACYSSMNVSGTVTLGAGTTYFTGPITFGNNSKLYGTGVTMVLDTGASLTAGQHNELHLSAPTSGTYPGMVIYQVAGNSNPMAIQNNSVTDFTGAVYLPSADLSIRNGLSATSDCILFVVNTLTIENGNGLLNNNCGSYGGSPLLTVSLAE